MSTGSDLDRRWAIMIPTSSTRDRGTWCFIVNQDHMRNRGRLIFAEVNFSWTYKRHNSGLGSIWHQKIIGHDDEAKSRWEVKRDYPNPRRQTKNEMRCPQPDTNADKCHVQERHTADDNDDGSIFSPPFLASTPIIFDNKREGDSICL